MSISNDLKETMGNFHKLYLEKCKLQKCKLMLLWVCFYNQMSIAQRTRSIHFHSIKVYLCLFMSWFVVARRAAGRDRYVCRGRGVGEQLGSHWQLWQKPDHGRNARQIGGCKSFFQTGRKKILRRFQYGFVCFFHFSFILFFDMFKIISFFFCLENLKILHITSMQLGFNTINIGKDNW